MGAGGKKRLKLILEDTVGLGWLANMIRAIKEMGANFESVISDEERLTLDRSIRLVCNRLSPQLRSMLVTRSVSISKHSHMSLSGVLEIADFDRTCMN